MDFFETIRNRTSVRSYEITSIPEDTIVKIIEAARLAPSAHNRQPWHFIAVKEEDKRIQIANGCMYGRFLARSPVVIVACGDKQVSSGWYVIDTAIALEHIALAATALGLGTCWIGLFNQEDIREMLKIPKNFEIVALMALGYPHKKTESRNEIIRRERDLKKIENILSLETYGNKPKISI